MGTPLLPPYLWTASGNYPAGPALWNGQPLAVAPSGTYVTPNTKPGAENWNYILGEITGGTNTLQAYVLSQRAQSWSPEFVTNGTLGFSAKALYCACWDPQTSRFVTVQSSASGTVNTTLYATYGLGQGTAAEWGIVGAAITTMSNNWYQASICYDPATSGKYFVAGVDSANTLAIYHMSGGLLALSSGAYTYYTSKLAVLGAYVMNFATTSSNTANDITSSNNSFATSTFVSSGLAFASGDGWNVKSNSSMVVAIPRQSGTYTVYYSTDGHTIHTSATLSALVASGNTVVGLAWSADALGACWIAAIQSVAGQPFWARSSDGINWSIQTGGVSTNMTVTDMASDGSSLLWCTLADTGGGASGMIFSVDGGITWYFNQGALTSSQNGGNGYIHPSLTGSPIGALYFNNLNARFSTFAGLPPTAL